MTDYAPIPQTPGRADHAAPGSLMSSLPFRTLLQGLVVDVLLAVCLVVYDSLQAESVDWRLLLLTLAKTALMTAASSVMKRVKPPAGQ